MPNPRSSRVSPKSDITMLERVHHWVDKLAERFPWGMVVISGISGVVATILGIIAGAFLPEEDKWWFPGSISFWLLLGVLFFSAVSVASGIVLDIARRDQDRGRVKAKVNAQEGLREAVLPSLRSVARLASLPSSSRSEQFTKMVSQVLLARSTVFAGKDGVRMVVYRLQGPKRGHRTLEPVDFDGRAKNIPMPFKSNEPGRGAKVFTWLDGGSPKTRFMPNCEMEADPDWAGTGNGYLTYISTPIMASDEVLGMLTVDAPRPGDLDETDVSMVEVLAQILGTAFVLRGE